MTRFSVAFLRASAASTSWRRLCTTVFQSGESFIFAIDTFLCTWHRVITKRNVNPYFRGLVSPRLLFGIEHLYNVMVLSCFIVLNNLFMLLIYYNIRVNSTQNSYIAFSASSSAISSLAKRSSSASFCAFAVIKVQFRFLT